MGLISNVLDCGIRNQNLGKIGDTSAAESHRNENCFSFIAITAYT